MAIHNGSGDEAARRIAALRRALASAPDDADAVLLVPVGGPLPDGWDAPWLQAGWSVTADSAGIASAQVQPGPAARSLFVSAGARTADVAATGAAMPPEVGLPHHDQRVVPDIDASTATIPAARRGGGTLRRGDFLDRLTTVIAMPGNEDWVLLAIRVDQLADLASLGTSTQFELEEQVFARLLARLHAQDLSTIWMEFGFGILIRRDDIAQVEAFAGQLCSDVAEAPFVNDGTAIRLTISIGMALVPPADTVEGGHRWFAIAHAAQSIALRHGGNQCEGVLTRAYGAMPPERVLIIREWLEEARKGSNVVVEFQPVLPLAADAVPMYTACVKLRDQRAPLGGVYRAEFRPLANGPDALTMIDRLSLFTALDMLEQERAQGRDTAMVVPIDLSTLDGVPWRWLEAQLVRRGALCAGLVLELQASAALQAPAVVERFARCRSLGVRISLDDRHGGLDSTRTWSALPVDFLRLPASTMSALPPAACIEHIAHWRDQGRRLILDDVESAGAITQLSQHQVDYLSGDGLAPIGPKLDFDFG